MADDVKQRPITERQGAAELQRAVTDGTGTLIHHLGTPGGGGTDRDTWWSWGTGTSHLWVGDMGDTGLGTWGHSRLGPQMSPWLETWGTCGTGDTGTPMGTPVGLGTIGDGDTKGWGHKGPWGHKGMGIRREGGTCGIRDPWGWGHEGMGTQRAMGIHRDIHGDTAQL